MVTRQEVITSLHEPEKFILAIVSVAGCPCAAFVRPCARVPRNHRSFARPARANGRTVSDFSSPSETGRAIASATGFVDLRIAEVELFRKGGCAVTANVAAKSPVCDAVGGGEPKGMTLRRRQANIRPTIQAAGRCFFCDLHELPARANGPISARTVGGGAH